MTGSTQARPLDNQRILLCVAGSIAAYKTLELVRRLRQWGAQVKIAMTSSAQQFVTPLSFQALSGSAPRTSLWEAGQEQAIGHIALARWADCVVVAPATANLIARFAQGFADDLVTTLCLATAAPLLVAPAMNHQMWQHSATQANVSILEQRGVQFIGPELGLMAEDESGLGRMTEPLDIASAVVSLFSQLSSGSGPSPVYQSRHGHRQTALTGLRIVISAGPTMEDLDPIRFLGNRSSGKMGFALADQAAQQGAHVVLIAGPVVQPTPRGVTRVDVRSAAQMRQAVLSALPADIYIGAAAVADYTPVQQATQKIKKSTEVLTIQLVRSPDILSEVAAQTGALKLVVGFAAETHDVERYARAKLEAKHLDLIIANQVGIADGGFESDTNAATAYWRKGQRAFARCNKVELAQQLLGLIAERLQA